jgi:hypothetical protein
MAENNSTKIVHLTNPADDDFPRVVTLHRSGQELVAVGAADGEDAARQVAILALKMEATLRGLGPDRLASYAVVIKNALRLWRLEQESKPNDLASEER